MPVAVVWCRRSWEREAPLVMRDLQETANVRKKIDTGSDRTIVRESAALPDDPIGTEDESVSTVNGGARRRDTGPSRRRRRPHGTYGATFLTSTPADSEHWRLASQFGCSTSVSIRELQVRARSVRRLQNPVDSVGGKSRCETDLRRSASHWSTSRQRSAGSERHFRRGAGESLFGARGAAPTTPDTLPSVWVDGSDAPAARVVL